MTAVRTRGVHHATIEIQSEARVTFHDVTPEVQARMKESGIVSGVAVVSSPHTTCSVFIQEQSYDTTYMGVEYLMQDLTDVLQGIVPECTAEGQYHSPGPKLMAHAAEEDEAFQPSWALNIDAHLRSVLIGRSESIPIIDGALELGQFGRIYFADFDRVRARERRVVATFIGDSSPTH
jgi:thiamine phosphate synthase YjbQ (UPF0047 family)